MNIAFFPHEQVHFLGDSATRPTDPPWGALGALLRLTVRIFRAVAGLIAGPSQHILTMAHSDVSNDRF